MKKKFGFILALVLYIIAICIITLLERGHPDANIKTIGDGFWYAIVTLTTVGYGDFYPVTWPGKITGLLLILGSLGILGYVIGEITTRFNRYMEKKQTGFFGTDFSDHYVFIGWSDFGKQVADQIFRANHKIAFVTNSHNDLNLIKDLYSSDKRFVLFADYNNLDAFTKVNINQAKAIFVNFPDDTATLVFVVNLKNRYPNAPIVVTCRNPELKATFMNAGITHVISRQEVASKLVASYIFEPHVATYTEDLIATSIQEEDYDILQYRVTKANPYCGKDYLDTFLDMKQKYNSVLIGLGDNGLIKKNPRKGTVIEQGQYLILISDGEGKKDLEKVFGVSEGN